MDKTMVTVKAAPKEEKKPRRCSKCRKWHPESEFKNSTWTKTLTKACAICRERQRIVQARCQAKRSWPYGAPPIDIVIKLVTPPNRAQLRAAGITGDRMKEIAAAINRAKPYERLAADAVEVVRILRAG